MKNQKLLSILCLIVIIISLHGCFCSNRDADEDGEVDSESKTANKKKSEKFQKLVKGKKDSKTNSKKEATELKLSYFMDLFKNEENLEKFFKAVQEDEQFSEDLKELTNKLSEALSEISLEELEKAMKEENDEVLTKINNILYRELDDPKVQKTMEKFMGICTKIFQNDLRIAHLLEQEEDVINKEDQYNDSAQEENIYDA